MTSTTDSDSVSTWSTNATVTEQDMYTVLESPNGRMIGTIFIGLLAAFVIIVTLCDVPKIYRDFTGETARQMHSNNKIRRMKEKNAKKEKLKELRLKKIRKKLRRMRRLGKVTPITDYVGEKSDETSKNIEMKCDQFGKADDHISVVCEADDDHITDPRGKLSTKKDKPPTRSPRIVGEACSYKKQDARSSISTEIDIQTVTFFKVDCEAGDDYNEDYIRTSAETNIPSASSCRVSSDSHDDDTDAKGSTCTPTPSTDSTPSSNTNTTSPSSSDTTPADHSTSTRISATGIRILVGSPK